MIQELLTYLTERPRFKEARAFGHLYESISLIAREKRCQRAWSPHRHECKNFISEHLHRASGNGSVLVLGSGPLHEIPIEVLAKKFKSVVLVDIVHLKSTRTSVAHLKNIEFIEHDITEQEKDLRVLKKLVSKKPQRFLDQKWDMILSINLMSQLPLHFENFIEKYMPRHFEASEKEAYLLELTAHHLGYLESFKTPVLLITDTETDYLDPQGKVLQSDHHYSHLKLPPPLHSWTWRVAPIPEFSKDIEMQMKVSGFFLNPLK